MINFFIIFLSFILEGILSLYIPFNINNLNIYYPSFILISLIFIYPKKKELNKYYFISFIIGLLYDLVYTDTLFFNSLLFLLSALIINKYYSKIRKNEYTILLLIILVITSYNILSYLLLVLFKDINFSIYNLLYKLCSSYFINLLYGYILYLLLSNKKKLRVIKHKRY